LLVVAIARFVPNERVRLFHQRVTNQVVGIFAPPLLVPVVEATKFDDVPNVAVDMRHEALRIAEIVELVLALIAPRALDTRLQIVIIQRRRATRLVEVAQSAKRVVQSAFLRPKPARLSKDRVVALTLGNADAWWWGVSRAISERCQPCGRK